jgi:hypothetical protein
VSLPFRQLDNLTALSASHVETLRMLPFKLSAVSWQLLLAMLGIDLNRVI